MNTVLRKPIDMKKFVTVDQLDDHIFEDVDQVASILYALESLFCGENISKEHAVDVAKIRPLLNMASKSMASLNKNLDARLVKEDLGSEINALNCLKTPRY